MAKIERVEILQVDLPPKVTRTDAIQSFVKQETPIVRIASISSVIFIVPSCAAKAEPERPATMIAVISVPSSRTVMRPMRLIV